MCVFLYLIKSILQNANVNNVTLIKAVDFYKELGQLIDFLLLTKLIHQYEKYYVIFTKPSSLK